MQDAGVRITILPATNMNTPAIVSWLFAACWLATAVRDVLDDSSPRHGNKAAILLSFVATGQLAWLGYLLFAGIKLLPHVVLVGFAITVLLWFASSRR